MALARERILETFHIESLKDLQREALEKFVGGRDVFLIQPTGSGKSLIFQSATIFFDIVRPKCAKSIVLVISPLVSLMILDSPKLRASDERKVLCQPILYQLFPRKN